MNLPQTSIPEVKENTIGYALEERKAKISQFLDLGPPDMLTMVKYTAQTGEPAGLESVSGRIKSTAEVDIAEIYSGTKVKGDLGTFLYVLGLDTSDPTSIAVNLKDLADTISEKPQSWFGKPKQYFVSRVTLSAWNTFRKCDVNAVVNIPGNLQTFAIDFDGNFVQLNGGGNEDSEVELIWAETFVSGVVRAMMLMKDNAEEAEIQPLVETLILNPLSSGQIHKTADLFIDLFPKMYERAPLLGGPCHVLNVSKTDNYLVETLIEVVKLTSNVEKCKDMLIELKKEFPEVAVILAKILFTCNKEIDAFQVTFETLKKFEELNMPNKHCYVSELLCSQAKYLIDVKLDFELALEIALMSVNLAPMDFMPWYLLTQVYTRLNRIEDALLTLNACPISVIKEKYVLKRVVAVKSQSNLHLPLPLDVELEEINSVNPQEIQVEQNSADPALLNLSASKLKSIFQFVYHLLSDIATLTSWESLLEYRSNIFVMEDEYGTTPNADTTESTSPPQLNCKSGKRLCERWLDDLFMLLYEDLKVFTSWQAEEKYFAEQENKYNKLPVEWEAYGLCARRLGHHVESARAFEITLSMRFAPESARRLLEFYCHQSELLKDSIILPNSTLKSSAITEQLTQIDQNIIDLCVKIVCWNHRWYIEYSTSLIESMAMIVQDMGLTKVSNQISAKYHKNIHKLLKHNLLDFFANYTNNQYDI